MSTWTEAEFRASGLKDVSYREDAKRRTAHSVNAEVAKTEIGAHSAIQEPSRASVYLPITPVPKPRMTQRDKWDKRPCVLRYREYCDSVRQHWGDRTFPPTGAWIVFHMPMPKSWSKRRKDRMRGRIHQQRPDKDNLEKAWNDALHNEDSHIADSRITKLWADVGYIEIYFDALPGIEQLQEAA